MKNLGLCLVGLITCFSFVGGCTASVEPATGDGEVTGTRVSQEALRGGCHVDCPKCNPTGPCPLRPCVLVCPPDVAPCGTTLCRNGDVCCNESCGICTPPGGACIDLYCAPKDECLQIALCIQGYAWSTAKCACVPDHGPNRCSSDADCRLFSDYCTGCDCRALGSNEQDPTCAGPGVRCFADPCLGKTTACVHGDCVVQ